MEWSPIQCQALDAVGKWLKGGSNDQQVFRLFGYAGTGKTTLAKHLAESAGTVLFACFTGKAASVLRSKGCPGASTIHSLIYQPRDDGTYRIDDLRRQLEELEAQLYAEAKAEAAPDEPAENIKAYVERNENVQRLKRQIAEEKQKKRKPIFELKADSPLRDADLLVVDEVSMVDEEMATDLMSFGTKILALGDPAQLPPVKGSGYFTDARPDILLTEIHRQARDNPIIDMATRVRSGESLRCGDYGTSRVITRADANKDLYLSHDQMLVGKNATRRAVNGRFRELLGRNSIPTPLAGDKLICLRNNHDLGLLNGTLWNCKAASPPFSKRISLTVEPFDGAGATQELVAHEDFFLGGEPSFYEMRDAESFDYGYAITTHKAQGSQWDNVLILDESACFRDEAERWLYTALTRAAQRVTVVI
jgi:exodeoxyribonuclease-5